jgi:hypothetical protein
MNVAPAESSGARNAALWRDEKLSFLPLAIDDAILGINDIVQPIRPGH